MVAANLKAETLKMMEKRSALETEMDAIISRLSGPSGPGLSGNLTDSEGFPRKDIDIPVIRAERRRLAELKNDHKEITEKINENIQVLHSMRLTPKSPSSKDSGDNEASGQISSLHSSVVPALRNTSAPMDVDFIVGMPFAVVGEISDNSPTAEDGLQLGDQIVKFGTLEYQSGENMLQKLASEVLINQGHAISLVVLRQGSPVNMTITPREWQGRGLLGCSFRAL